MLSSVEDECSNLPHPFQMNKKSAFSKLLSFFIIGDAVFRVTQYTYIPMFYS